MEWVGEKLIQSQNNLYSFSGKGVAGTFGDRPHRL
jgi:hypothetical protein